MHRAAERTQRDWGRATIMSAIVYLLPSLCLLCSSLKTNFLSHLYAMGQMWLLQALLPTISHASVCKRLRVSASLVHLPRKKNLQACFDQIFPTKTNWLFIGPRMIYRSTSECRVLASVCVMLRHMGKRSNKLCERVRMNLADLALDSLLWAQLTSYLRF